MCNHTDINGRYKLERIGNNICRCTLCDKVGNPKDFINTSKIVEDVNSVALYFMNKEIKRQLSKIK